MNTIFCCCWLFALENCMASTLDSGQMKLSFAEHVDSGMLLFC